MVYHSGNVFIMEKALSICVNKQKLSLWFPEFLLRPNCRAENAHSGKPTNLCLNQWKCLSPVVRAKSTSVNPGPELALRLNRTESLILAAGGETLWWAPAVTPSFDAPLRSASCLDCAFRLSFSSSWPPLSDCFQAHGFLPEMPPFLFLCSFHFLPLRKALEPYFWIL